MTNQLHKSSLAKLRSTFGKNRVWFGDEIEGRSKLGLQPSALVSVQEPAEIDLVLSLAKSDKIPLVTRALGTRIEGLACSQAACLELDLQRMQGVLEINQDSLWVQAQAGTALQQIADSAREVGLRIEGLAEDELTGSLGGFLSTHARINDPITGLDQPGVLHVEALLSSGISVRSVPAPRAAVGPDLFSLLLGTRGGLGVITSASLKLEPIPEEVQTLDLSFANLESALAFVRRSHHALLMPRQLRVYLCSDDSSVSVSLCLEGLSKMVDATVAQIRGMASQTNGSWIDQQTPVAAQRIESQPDLACQTFIYWSMLFEVLHEVGSLISGAWAATVTDVDLTGASLQVHANGATSHERCELRQRLVRLGDPHQRSHHARAQGQALLQRIRADLDPDRILNPHAWTQVCEETA